MSPEVDLEKRPGLGLPRERLHPAEAAFHPIFSYKVEVSGILRDS